MTDDRALGQRIATLRKARHLEQAELAPLAAMSVSMLSQVERGVRRPSPTALESLAEALRVTPEHLLDGPGHSDSRVNQALPAIRAAIVDYDDPDDGPTPALPDLAVDVQRMAMWRLDSQYIRVAEQAPGLVAALQRAVHAHTGADQQRAARLLLGAYRSIDAACYKHRHYDLSARLIELMRWSAQIAQEPSLDAVVAYVRTETHFATGALTSGLRALERAVDRTPTPRSITEQASLGALHMRAAVVAARIRDRDAARQHLQLAAARAASVREDVYHGTAVGPDSLRIHELAVAVELGETAPLATAVRAASHWAPPLNLPAERRSHYYIDLGRAQMTLGQPRYALESLEVARSIAPQHVREHGQVRAELATMVRLSRRTGDRLLAFAQWARAV